MAVGRVNLMQRFEQARERLKTGHAGIVLRREWVDLLRYLRLWEPQTTDEEETATNAAIAASREFFETAKQYLQNHDDNDVVTVKQIRLAFAAISGVWIDPPAPNPVIVARREQAIAWLTDRMTNGAPGSDPANLNDIRALIVVLQGFV